MPYRLLKLPLFALLMLPALSAAAAPEQYPEFTTDQLAQWKPLLVVAEITPGEYYPKKECPQGSVCINLTSAFWVKAKVRATLQGTEPPTEIRVMSASHWGMQQFPTDEGPYLVSLRSDGEKYMMPRYAAAPLVRDKLGALYLLTHSRGSVSWLPCGVEALREEVFQKNFPNGDAIARGEHQPYRAKQAPDLFRVDATGVWNRYAIPIARLHDFLVKAGPEVKMSCEPGSAR